jgi:hypothetical protein
MRRRPARRRPGPGRRRLLVATSGRRRRRSRRSRRQARAPAAGRRRPRLRGACVAAARVLCAEIPPDGRLAGRRARRNAAVAAAPAPAPAAARGRGRCSRCARGRRVARRRAPPSRIRDAPEAPARAADAGAQGCRRAWARAPPRTALLRLRRPARPRLLRVPWPPRGLTACPEYGLPQCRHRTTAAPNACGPTVRRGCRMRRAAWDDVPAAALDFPTEEERWGDPLAFVAKIPAGGGGAVRHLAAHRAAAVVAPALHACLTRRPCASPRASRRCTSCRTARPGRPPSRRAAPEWCGAHGRGLAHGLARRRRAWVARRRRAWAAARRRAVALAGGAACDAAAAAPQAAAPEAAARASGCARACVSVRERRAGGRCRC